MSAMPRPVRVLIVDDNKVICELLHSLLQQEGFEVTGRAHSAQQALDLVRLNPPEIVCLDLRLPDKDGLDVLAEVKAEFPAIHVLVVSGSSDRKDMEQAVGRGAIGFIHKPFNVAQVEATMRRLAAIVHRPHYPPAAGTGVVKRVVIIDAQAEMRRMLRQVLEEGGYFVADEAADGMQGLMAVDREAPDLVCLDIDLPEIDGLNALNAIKACHPQVAVVVATIHTDRALVQQSIQAGATGYLIKPFDPERVLEAVSRALAASHGH